MGTLLKIWKGNLEIQAWLVSIDVLDALDGAVQLWKLFLNIDGSFSVEIGLNSTC